MLRKICGWGFAVDSQSPIRRASLCAIRSAPLTAHAPADGAPALRIASRTMDLHPRQFVNYARPSFVAILVLTLTMTACKLGGEAGVCSRPRRVADLKARHAAVSPRPPWLEERSHRGHRETPCPLCWRHGDTENAEKDGQAGLCAGG